VRDDSNVGDILREFRAHFHGCLRQRADALFELTDAILTPGTVSYHPILASLPSTGEVSAASTRP